MRHNLQILSSLIKSQNNSEALAYINNLQVNLQDTRQSAYCRNKIINAALLVYISKAEEHNISVITETDIPEEIPLNSNEIAVLLSNALENAVNASLRQSMSSRSIQISAKYTKNKLAIIIANKFSDKIEFSKSGFPITEAQGHGIGTQSMMSIIDKNNAVFSCSHENKWFKFACIFQRNDNIIL
jgi:sensor histidine kinase regulating citrate/malate metabolism